MIRTRFLATAALALMLAGCGFHLRSRIALPSDLGPVLVRSSATYSDLAYKLVRGLQVAGADAHTPTTADLEAEKAAVASGETVPKKAELVIVSERWGDLPIAVDSLGRAQEYSLRYAVVFVFRKADGTDLVPQQVVELSRDYVSPPENATGTTTEREILADELRREMSASILRRVDGVVRAGQLVKPADGT
ncbi:MAG TPA: LPS assembly lipoprotein LptE [Pseudoxanthomonas sp.]